jgi:tripartite-type tricarboxylate transporter receptor subunit TctC
VRIDNVSNVLAFPVASAANCFERFVNVARSNVNKLSYGSTSVGTSSHLLSFLLVRRLNVEAVYIPYEGAIALNDFLSGRLRFVSATFLR